MSSIALLPPKKAESTVPVAMRNVKMMIKMLDLPVRFTRRPTTVTPTREATKQIEAKTTA